MTTVVELVVCAELDWPTWIKPALDRLPHRLPHTEGCPMIAPCHANLYQPLPSHIFAKAFTASSPPTLRKVNLAAGWLLMRLQRKSHHPVSKCLKSLKSLREPFTLLFGQHDAKCTNRHHLTHVKLMGCAEMHPLVALKQRQAFISLSCNKDRPQPVVNRWDQSENAAWTNVLQIMTVTNLSQSEWEWARKHKPLYATKSGC